MPFKTIQKVMDNESFPVVQQYIKGSTIYEVLDRSQCYSGYMITLMKLPQLTFDQLLATALSSRYYSERAGATGFLLKHYPKELEKLFCNYETDGRFAPVTKKKIRRMARFIDEFVRNNTSYVWSEEKILALCSAIKSCHRGLFA